MRPRDVCTRHQRAKEKLCVCVCVQVKERVRNSSNVAGPAHTNIHATHAIPLRRGDGGGGWNLAAPFGTNPRSVYDGISTPRSPRHTPLRNILFEIALVTVLSLSLALYLSLPSKRIAGRAQDGQSDKEILNFLPMSLGLAAKSEWEGGGQVYGRSTTMLLELGVHDDEDDDDRQRTKHISRQTGNIFFGFLPKKCSGILGRRQNSLAHSPTW